MKSSFLIFTCFFLAGCFLTKKTPVSLTSEKSSSINIGDSQSTVSNLFGEPDLKRTNDDFNLEWIYSTKDEYKSQKVLVSFDQLNLKVNGIMITPEESEKEFSIDFLREKKFPGINFKEYSLKRCKRHFFPTTVFYINELEGIIISYDKHFKYVNYFSKQPSNPVKRFIGRIENCTL